MVNNEMEKTSKKVTVTSFEVFALGGLKKKKREKPMGPPEYEVGILLT